MDVNVTVRHARMVDYAPMCELFGQGDALHAGALPHLFRQAQGPSRDREFIERVLSDADALLLVAEHAGQIVGVLRAGVRQAPGHPPVVPRSFVEVSELTVREGFRGRGIGTLLMDSAHVWATEKGAGTVELTVWDFNTDALTLYEKLGYTTMYRRLSRAV
jgi:ribosomal protein S18 acetylase RimI-like enzyme